MKNALLLSFGAVIACLTFAGWTSGPSGTSAGSNIAIAGCNGSGTGCHGTASTNTTSSIMLINQSTNDTVTNGEYTPGANYDIIVTGMNATALDFGFAFTASHTGPVQAGTFTNPATGTQLTPLSPLTVFEHSGKIDGMSGSFSASVEWTAPAQGSGDVSFALTVNGVDSNNAATGDEWSTNLITYREGPPASVNDVTAKNGIVLYPNPAINSINVQVLNSRSTEYSYHIYNVDGSIAMHGQFVQDGQISIRDLPVGNYFIKVSDGNNTTAVPFIKL